jgi:hypothetical protein
MEPAKKKAK